VYAAARRSNLLETLAVEANGNITPIVLDRSDDVVKVARIRAIDDVCGWLDLVVAKAGVSLPAPAGLADWFRRAVERGSRIVRFLKIHDAAAIAAAYICPRT
jgi:NADP-dependent 3-hydroxy acid dehydrogenase YdfG